MMNLRDKTARPTLEDIAAYVQNPVFQGFCTELNITASPADAIAFPYTV